MRVLSTRKTRPRKRCRWCGRRLGTNKHLFSESFCFVKNEASIRNKLRPRIKLVSEAYEGGRLRSEFVGTKMEDVLTKRQQQRGLDAVLGMSRNGYKVPRNVSHILAQGFVWNQISHERPWAVVVLTPKGKKRKRFNNLLQAVQFHERATRLDLSAGIVSLCHAYELPPEYRLKKADYPKRFKWCPGCADFRVFRRREPLEKFEASIKRWNADKGRFEWHHRLVWVTECQLCGYTNRSPVYRRANQPYEVRRIKQGVRRVKPRKGAPRRKTRRRL